MESRVLQLDPDDWRNVQAWAAFHATDVLRALAIGGCVEQALQRVRFLIRNDLLTESPSGLAAAAERSPSGQAARSPAVGIEHRLHALFAD